MKRTLSFDYSKESSKMMKVANETITPNNRISSSLERHFAYKLSDKKATTNLLKSAAREPIEIVERQKCNIIVLNVGSYIETVLPLLVEL